MLALITGATSGIGLMYAHELASKGHDIIIVSNQDTALKDTQSLIEEKYNVKCIAFNYDLTADKACENLYNCCMEAQLEVDILINNAGVFFFNELKDTARTKVETMLDLHVKAVTTLTQLFSRDMIERRKGYILNMSSMSAWITFPGITTYSATKSYLLSFSKSMWYELRPHNVSITAVCPGAVDTGLYGLSTYWRKVAVRIGVSMPPEKLVRKALRKMFAKKKQYLPGAINHIFLPVMKHLPDFVVLYAVKRIRQFMK